MRKSLPSKSQLSKIQKRLPGTCGVNKVVGLEVNVKGLDELRLELGLDRLQVSHITTSFKSFGRKTQGEAER